MSERGYHVATFPVGSIVERTEDFPLRLVAHCPDGSMQVVDCGFCRDGSVQSTVYYYPPVTFKIGKI